MTKTLTEQWRNEELPIDLYYVIDKLGRETIGNDCGIRDMMVDAFNGGNIFIKEVLAPVPSYDEYCNLVFQANKPKNPLSDVMMCYDTEREKEVVERLQEQLDIVTEQRNDIHIDKQVLQKQLNEANRIIKKLYKESGNPIGIDYLEKWGVK